MRNSLCLFIVVLFFSSCATPPPPPEQIVSDYYGKIIINDIENAKKLCQPSAIEEVDRLNEIEAFTRNINKGKLEIMEVIVSPKPMVGDTAIVNYKIDNYKNFLTLILDKEEWKIAMSDELKQLQILEFRSFDLTNICVENPNVFWEKYNGIYFNVLNLCLGEDSYNAIPYSVDNNMIYANVSKSENDLYGLPIIRRFYTLFNKKISYNSALSAEYGSAKVDYNLKNLNASDKSKLKLAKLTNPYSLDDPKINFNNIISFRGKLNGIDFRDSQINKKMTFKKCSITEVLNK